MIVIDVPSLVLGFVMAMPFWMVVDRTITPKVVALIQRIRRPHGRA